MDNAPSPAQLIDSLTLIQDSGIDCIEYRTDDIRKIWQHAHRLGSPPPLPEPLTYISHGTLVALRREQRDIVQTTAIEAVNELLCWLLAQFGLASDATHVEKPSPEDKVDNANGQKKKNYIPPMTSDGRAVVKRFRRELANWAPGCGRKKPTLKAHVEAYAALNSLSSTHLYNIARKNKQDQAWTEDIT